MLTKFVLSLSILSLLGGSALLDGKKKQKPKGPNYSSYQGLNPAFIAKKAKKPKGLS